MKRRTIHQLLAGIAFSLAFITPSTTPVAGAEDLTVYTAIEAEDLKKYAERFNASHPDINIKWVRDSTGIITAKLLAEKNNPQADVIWGLAASSLLLLKTEGMLEPYAPKGVEKLDPKFVDKSNPPAWTGMDAWVAAVCFNTVEAEKAGLPVPKTWKDLLKPVYKGHVVMPNPNSSGTGFLDVSSWLQMFGEDEGWKYMDGLHENIARYTHSGSKPCKLAAAGEMSPVFPSPSAAPSQSSKARRSRSSCRKRASAGTWKRPPSWPEPPRSWTRPRRWSTGRSPRRPTGCTTRAMRWSRSRASPSRSRTSRRPAEKMIDNDFEWAANNRARILDEWPKRYDSKSEPKS